MTLRDALGPRSGPQDFGWSGSGRTVPLLTSSPEESTSFPDEALLLGWV